MDVVFGDGPLAVAIARGLSPHETVVLAGPNVVAGPHLWRRASLDTGEGVAHALLGADRAFVAIEPGVDLGGFFSVLKPGAVSCGVAVLLHGMEMPPALRRFGDWSTLRVGPVWGPSEPVVAAWAQQIVEGAAVWVTDPGPMWPVAEADFVEVVRAAAEHRAARWTLGGDEEARLSELASVLAGGLGATLRSWNVPGSLAARRAGVDASRWEAWITASEARTSTPGWERPEGVGQGGWIGDRERWSSKNMTGSSPHGG